MFDLPLTYKGEELKYYRCCENCGADLNEGNKNLLYTDKMLRLNVFQLECAYCHTNSKTTQYGEYDD